MAEIRKMIYVSKGAATWWVRGEQLATGHGMSMSKYIAFLLRREVMAHEMSRAGGKGKVPKSVEDLRYELSDLRAQMLVVEDEILTRLGSGAEVSS
jgi:hypothetical protein